MKTLKKVVSLLLVAALVFTLGLTAFADSTTPHTITIENPDAGEAHEFTAYQVFAGNYDPNTTALSDVSWGSGVNGVALLEALRTELPDFAGCQSAAEVVKVLANYPSNSEELRAFAAVVDRFTTTPAGSATGDAANDAVINVVGDGYYYVKDTSANLTVDTYSDYILLVEGDVTIEAKDTTGVVSYKKVEDINDSTDPVGGYSDWQDSADYDIGDPVPFQLNGTVAADYDKYDSYKLVFHDKESEGLTFQPDTVRVFVDGVEIFAGFEVVFPNDGCTFDILFEDLKAIPEVEGGSLIQVEYFSILNEDAIIGVPGNPNEMRMEYSNNPTDETSTGFTPWDKVVVFTYEVIVDKVDENGEPLTGAEFQMEKWVIDEEHPEGHWVVVPGEVNGEESSTGDGEIIRINDKIVRTYVDPATGELYYVVLDKPGQAPEPFDVYLKASDVEAISSLVAGGSAIGIQYYRMEGNTLVPDTSAFSYTISSISRKSNAGTTFTWKGVDDGHYRITETVTPPGYNTIEPIEFDIIAEHSIESEDPILISIDGDPFLPTEENMGILHADIENHSGGILPSTGGIGTTLFYVLGGLLVLGAGILLVVKKFSDAN